MISFEKFTNGLSIVDIAAERNLSATTIETHLSHYIAIGEISIDKLLEPKQCELIRAIILNEEDHSLNHLKPLLPFATYSEIRFVVADLKYKKSLELSPTEIVL